MKEIILNTLNKNREINRAIADELLETRLDIDDTRGALMEYQRLSTCMSALLTKIKQRKLNG